nr:integrase, catalytic region, zinc finger, CCHC-type, peptidase aspartic, catalytic [Tanacetum cinerariifolium]
MVSVVHSGQDNAIDDDVDEQPAQDLALNVDNVFQDDIYDAFDSDVDEAPTTQTMFMANLSSADLVTDEAGPSYDSDILFEVQANDHYQDTVCAHHEEHTTYNNVQLNHVVDSHADYTSDSNMIPYDQYVKDNTVSVVHSNNVQGRQNRGQEIHPRGGGAVGYGGVQNIVGNANPGQARQDVLDCVLVKYSWLRFDIYVPDCVLFKIFLVAF